MIEAAYTAQQSSYAGKTMDTEKVRATYGYKMNGCRDGARTQTRDFKIEMERGISLEILRDT